MATYKKISDLAEATVLNSDDELLITQSGISKRLAGELLQEIGSNDNGDYVQFSSGVQICWVVASVTAAVNTTWGNIFISSIQEWTFPKAFTSTIGVAGISTRTGQTSWLLGDETTKTAFKYYIARGSTTTSVTWNPRIVAVGYT